MNTKTERFEMRLDPGTLDKVDDWRGEQADLPSRAEAVRRLMETGLSASKKKPLRFSAGEKLVALMLCELYKHLDIDSEIDPSFVESALHGGHYWGLEWQYSGIFHGHEDSEESVSEVVDVLDMWWFIENSYEKLSKTDKDRVRKETSPAHVNFPGFDGHNESEHLSIARFLIKDLERFSDFDGRIDDLNSHMPMVESYRRMVPVFEPMRRGLGGGNLLNAGQIIDILNAWRSDGRR